MFIPDRLSSLVGALAANRCGLYVSNDSEEKALPERGAFLSVRHHVCVLGQPHLLPPQPYLHWRVDGSAISCIVVSAAASLVCLFRRWGWKRGFSGFRLMHGMSGGQFCLTALMATLVLQLEGDSSESRPFGCLLAQAAGSIEAQGRSHRSQDLTTLETLCGACPPLNWTRKGYLSQTSCTSNLSPRIGCEPYPSTYCSAAGHLSSVFGGSQLPASTSEPSAW